MKVLILGSGAREHAVAWKFSRSKRISGLYIAPGNAGTEALGENLPNVDPESPNQVLETCREKNINYVFVGPEAPLAAGIVDRLNDEGIAVFGPHKAAAMLEASKTFSKEFMIRHNVPTAEAREFDDKKSFKNYIKEGSGLRVIKKSGLAAGKGVLESDDNEILEKFGLDILKDDKLLVEQFLKGYEISIFTLTDGETYKMLPPCADFKKAGDHDKGPNTGGMGAICPVPVATESVLKSIEEEIIVPTFQGLKKDGLSFKGLLYFGIMMTEEGPKLLEYNVRFGDPETQVLLPLIESDFGNLCDAIAKGKLKDFPLRISDKSALGVVVAAEGYPGPYKKGTPVLSLPKFSEKEDLFVFHASTVMGPDGETPLTGGGRCFTVVTRADNLLKARSKVYKKMDQVKFKGAWFRSDIGNKFFED